MQFVRTGQWIVSGKWVGESRDGLIEQVKYRALNRLSQWLRQSFDLEP